MSKVNLTIDTNYPRTISIGNIPKGTVFTGKIGKYDERAFVKGYGTVVAFETGGTWSECDVNNYVVCDATINLEPVR